jgi:hypothetical protein
VYEYYVCAQTAYVTFEGFKGSCCLRKVLSASNTRTFAVCERYLDKQADAMLKQASFEMRCME